MPQRFGLFYAFITYLFWGLSPLYWKAFSNYSTSEVLANRILWSFVFTILILTVQRSFKLIKQLKDFRVIRVYIISSALLAINWFVYIYAVANDYVLESSLGYFITPLINVLLGFIVLKERLRLYQWFAIGLCCVGVAYRTISYGSLPIIALTLAITFGFYGLIRKQAPLNAIDGMAIESFMLLVPALSILSYLTMQQNNHFAEAGLSSMILFISAGLYTAIPLISFAAAAKRMPLGILGMLMYLNPTLQFLCGRFIFNEPFDQNSLIAFSIIWIALIFFTVEGLLFSRRQHKLNAASV